MDTAQTGGWGFKQLGGGHQDSGTAARYFNQTRWSEQDNPEWPGFQYIPKAATSEREAGCEALPKRTAGELCDREEGSAGLTARAGAGRTSKGRANFHPTVKPLALMRWLCRLVTRKDGVILEPFTGSGTTLMAAIVEGFRCVAFELTAEYEPIIRARAAWAEREREIATCQIELFP
jgi:site-specific DNA-methyltransferase (adenine-specific)